MSEPKRQHYVPRSYLAKFCRDGRIWIRDAKKQENRRDRPENVAVINHYYSIEKDGKWDNAIEKGLAELEASALPLVNDLSVRKHLTVDSKYALSMYIAFQWLRVPDFEKSINKVGKHMIRQTLNVMFRDEEDVKKSLEDFTQETGKVIKAEPKKLLVLLREENLEIKIKRELSLDIMLKQANAFANMFQQMDWLVLHAKKECSFVTSDNPLVLAPPSNFPKNSLYGYGIATLGCKKIFPLTQACCLVMLDKGEAIAHHCASKSYIRSINQFLASRVCRFLFARDKELVDSLKSIADEASQNRDGRVTVN